MTGWSIIGCFKLPCTVVIDKITYTVCMIAGGFLSHPKETSITKFDGVGRPLTIITRLES
jgi:hypothetical protein